MIESDPLLWDRFFALDTVGALRGFAAGLDASTPERAALAYYISTWREFADANDNVAFVPTCHLSADRSAVKYGNSPVIFEGTNLWAWKPYFKTEALAPKLRDLENLVGYIRDSNPKARMTLVLVPEKDHVMSRFLLKETRFDVIDRAVNMMSKRLATRGLPLIFSQPFVEIDRFLTLADFEYGDSHLPSRHYVTIFGFALESLGISWASLRDRIALLQLPEFGDLTLKFENTAPHPGVTFRPNMPDDCARQTAGTASFAQPLRDTWQTFRNDKALIDQSVCVLGDSHCSIHADRRLTYLFANTFRTADFVWNPSGIEKIPDVAAYDNVVLEISTRFTM